MKRIVSFITLFILLVSLTSCLPQRPDAPDAEDGYQQDGSINRFAELDLQPMLYILYSYNYDYWYGRDVSVLNEKGELIVENYKGSAWYIMDPDKPAGTPESVFGVLLRSRSSEDQGWDIVILDKSGKKVTVPDGPNLWLNQEIRFGFMEFQTGEFDTTDEMDPIFIGGSGLYDVAGGRIAIEPRYQSLEILDENLVYASDKNGCFFLDFKGNVRCELTGISWVHTYLYDGSGVFVAENESDRKILIDKDGNRLTEKDYYWINGEFFGEYTIAYYYWDNYDAKNIVLLNKQGQEFPMPGNNSAESFIITSNYAVAITPDGFYTIGKDRTASALTLTDDYVSWGTEIGGVVFVQTDTDVYILNQNGEVVETRDNCYLNTFYYSESFVAFTKSDDRARQMELYTIVNGTLKKYEHNVLSVINVTPDGQLFICLNSAAYGFKDMQGNWVYKQSNFEELSD